MQYNNFALLLIELVNIPSISKAPDSFLFLRMRIDRFIWCVRLFKTRSLASKACETNKVMIGSEIVKAAKIIKADNQFAVRDIPIWRTYKVLDIPKSRLGAKLVSDYIIETTPQADKDLHASVQEENRQNRVIGLKGRPTKKVRRDIDRYKE